MKAHNQACEVEAVDGHVVVECGPACFTLRPLAAIETAALLHDHGQRALDQATPEN